MRRASDESVNFATAFNLLTNSYLKFNVVINGFRVVAVLVVSVEILFVWLCFELELSIIDCVRGQVDEKLLFFGGE